MSDHLALHRRPGLLPPSGSLVRQVGRVTPPIPVYRPELSDRSRFRLTATNALSRLLGRPPVLAVPFRLIVPVCAGFGPIRAIPPVWRGRTLTAPALAACALLAYLPMQSVGRRSTRRTMSRTGIESGSPVKRVLMLSPPQRCSHLEASRSRIWEIVAPTGPPVNDYLTLHCARACLVLTGHRVLGAWIQLVHWDTTPLPANRDKR